MASSKTVNCTLKKNIMPYFGMGFGQSEIPRPQRRISRLKKLKDYIDDKNIKYKSNIVRDEAHLKDRRKIIVNDYIKRRKERSSGLTFIFLIILFFFIIAFIKIIISLKSKFFAFNRIQVVN